MLPALASCLPEARFDELFSWTAVRLVRFRPRLVLGLLTALSATAFAGPASAQLLISESPEVAAVGAHEVEGNRIDHLSEALPGYSIARCMFPSGRLVLKRDDALVVLRQGDAVPGSEGDSEGLRVVEISETRAVLASRWKLARQEDTETSVPVPGQIVMIDVTQDGSTLVTVGTAQAPAASVVLEDDPGVITTLPYPSPSGTPPGGDPGGGLPDRLEVDVEEVSPAALPISRSEGQQP